MNIFVSGFFGGGGRGRSAVLWGFTGMCVCVCGGWIEGHGSPTTASHAVQQLHCWIPLMSFGLRIRTTEEMWEPVPKEAGLLWERTEEMAPKNNANEKFPDLRTDVFMQLTPRCDGQEVYIS